jgi:hypothetical protein
MHCTCAGRLHPRRETCPVPMELATLLLLPLTLSKSSREQ